MHAARLRYPKHLREVSERPRVIGSGVEAPVHDLGHCVEQSREFRHRDAALGGEREERGPFRLGIVGEADRRRAVVPRLKLIGRADDRQPPEVLPELEERRMIEVEAVAVLLKGPERDGEPAAQRKPGIRCGEFYRRYCEGLSSACVPPNAWDELLHPSIRRHSVPLPLRL